MKCLSLDDIKEHLPDEKPHYLMGVGLHLILLVLLKEVLICLIVFYQLDQEELD